MSSNLLKPFLLEISWGMFFCSWPNFGQHMLFFSEMAYSLLADFVSSENINGNVSLALCHYTFGYMSQNDAELVGGVCSPAALIEVPLKYKRADTCYIYLHFFSCQITRVRKCLGFCPPDAQNLVGKEVVIFIKNEWKKWNVFIHPSHFTLLPHTSKFTRWQSLRKTLISSRLSEGKEKQEKAQGTEWESGMGEKSHRKRYMAETQFLINNFAWRKNQMWGLKCLSLNLKMSKDGETSEGY